MNHLGNSKILTLWGQEREKNFSTLDQRRSLQSGGHGYFAGQGTGIVTVAGKPARREIWALNLRQNRLIASIWSGEDGTFFLPNLDPAQEYLLICRDYEKERAPFAWDYRLPAVEMTLREQLDLLAKRGFIFYDHDKDKL